MKTDVKTDVNKGVDSNRAESRQYGRRLRRPTFLANFLASVLASAVLALAGVSISGAVLAADITGNADAAKDKISMCIGCHSIPGYKSSYPTVFSVPKIAGQSAKYLENALKAYRKGDRSYPTMRGIAGSLTDQDIADLAAYFAKLEQ